MEIVELGSEVVVKNEPDNIIKGLTTGTKVETLIMSSVLLVNFWINIKTRLVKLPKTESYFMFSK